MARLDQDFTGDLADLDRTIKKVIAPGRYKATIVQCDYVQNKNKDGFNLIPTFQIVEGEYKGEQIMQWLCIKHPNKTTQDIAISKKSRLGVILCGTPNPSDTSQLCGKPLVIETDTEANNYINNQGIEVQGTNNIIKQYHPINGEFKDLIAGKKSTTPGVINEPKVAMLDDEIPF